MNGTVLGLLALALLGQAGLVWMRSIREVRTGERRPLVIAVIAAALGIAALAFARAPGALGGFAAGLTLALGGVFLANQVIGRQARRTAAVSVGGPILDFTAPDADGRPFALASLRGRPYLLKFFRGHW